MNKKYRVLAAITLILIAVCVYAGITYAAWSMSFEQTNENHLISGCFSMAFSDEESISLKGEYPKSDASGLKNPAYKFRIKNTCTIYGRYAVVLDIKSDSTFEENKIKVALENDGSLSPTILNTLDEMEISEVGYTKSYILTEDGLSDVDVEKEYDLKIWIDSAAGNEVMGQRLSARLRIVSIAGEPLPPKLKDLILAQGGGAEAIEAKGNPAFNVVPTAATSGIYATEDEYGTSYYYRGERNSLNNNLIFAGFQWKIVRVNGDSSVRIIYNGTEEQYNSTGTMNTTGSNTQVGTSAFNTTRNDVKYVGYMYGGNAGVASASLTQAQTNETNSTIKTYLDGWYVNNIETQGTTVINLLTDNLFCNDRQLGRDYPGAPTTGTGWNGTGFGTSWTYYAPYYRHWENRSNPTPTLKCAQKNDRFTVSDTTIGNASLTYPVGLITADEIAYGGTTVSYYNTNQYLSTSQWFWSLSPSVFDHNSDDYDSSPDVWSVRSFGDLNRSGFVDRTLGVRPLLNLRLDVVVTSGDGSAINPFRVA